MIGKTWKSVHLIFHRLIQRDFCWCEFALSNSQSYDNHTPKRPLIKNKVCNYLTSKYSMFGHVREQSHTIHGQICMCV